MPGKPRCSWLVGCFGLLCVHRASVCQPGAWLSMCHKSRRCAWLPVYRPSSGLAEGPSMAMHGWLCRRLSPGCMRDSGPFPENPGQTFGLQVPDLTAASFESGNATTDTQAHTHTHRQTLGSNRLHPLSSSPSDVLRGFCPIALPFRPSVRGLGASPECLKGLLDSWLRRGGMGRAAS